MQTATNVFYFMPNLTKVIITNLVLAILWNINHMPGNGTNCPTETISTKCSLLYGDLSPSITMSTLHCSQTQKLFNYQYI